MRSHINLGRVFGIEIGLHYSWLLIAVMIAVSLASHFGATHPEWDPAAVWAAAVLTALLFFVTLLAHEMAHSLVARSRGLPVRSITLFALGGVAQIEKEPQDARTEFWMAIAGPLASVAIGAGCLGLAAALGWEPASRPAYPMLAVLVWLGYINLSLAVFNMIPGFPLDGGRVLRAIVWWISGDGFRATRIAANVGRVVAVLMIAAGVLRFAAGAGIGGLWISFIGWFLFQAAGASWSQARITELLRGVRVGDLMHRDCPTVDARTNLHAFLTEVLTHTPRFCYVVLLDGRPAGLISPREVRHVPRSQWLYKTVGDVMSERPAIAPDAPVTEALETMGREQAPQLPVGAAGHIEGIISQASVIGFLQARGHLRI